MKNAALLIIVTVLLAAGAYWYFFTGTGNVPPLTVTSTSANHAQTRFQTLANQLQPISFDTSIFTDAHFNSLIDLTTPISPETSGRVDPFAVLTK